MLKKREKKGFTLAELLIVIAIIAILIAIAVPVFASSMKRANEATDCANIRALKAAAVAHYLDETAKGSAGTGTVYLNNAGEATTTKDGNCVTFKIDQAENDQLTSLGLKKEAGWTKGQLITCTIDANGGTSFSGVAK